jgi:hypothetical protein
MEFPHDLHMLPVVDFHLLDLELMDLGKGV